MSYRLLAVSLSLVWSCGSADRSAGHDLYRQGRVALARGDYRKAVLILRRAVARHPRHEAARVALADALVRTRALEQAEGVLRQGLERRPRSARLWLRLGQVLRRRGRYDAAVKALDRARRLEPGGAEAALELGDIYQVYRLWDVARSHYQSVLTLSVPRASHAEAHHRLALLARRQDQPEEEIRQLRLAVRLAASRGAWYGELGSALLAAGRPAEALPFLQRCCELEPRSGSAHLALGRAYLELGQKDEAIAALGRAARLMPRRTAPLVALARGLLALGREDEAYQAAVKAIALAPGDHEVQWLLVPLYLKRRLVEPAGALLQGLLPARAHDPVYWQLLGRVRALQGRPGEAREAFARALTLRPRDLRLVRSLAFATRRAGDYRQAIKRLAEVLRQRPDDYEALIHLGISQEHLGRRAAARRTLSRASRLAPRRPEAHLYLGWIALRAGAPRRARELALKADHLARGRSAHALDVLCQAHVRLKQPKEAQAALDRVLKLELGAGDRRYFQSLARKLSLKGQPAPRKP